MTLLECGLAIGLVLAFGVGFVGGRMR